MKQFCILSIWIFFSTQVFAQNHTLSGYIKDSSNGEILIGATVYIPELETGTVTNAYGYYSILVPAGTHRVSYSYIGYNSQSYEITFSSNQKKIIMLEETPQDIEEVLVSAVKRNKNVENIAMSMEKMQVKLIKKLPTFMGEVDVLKSITMLPGIQNGGEGSSGLYVRGGGPDENLLLLDEAPVYNASHLMGFFSVFNSDAIKDIQVYKGGIPAIYGGKASSVVDIRMKDGNSKKFQGNGGIGNISSRLTFEGPIIKDKWSFIVSGRRTYADFIGKLAGLEALEENQLYFYDLNLKTNVQLGDNDRIYLSAYTGDDYFKLGESLYMRWGNITGTLRWNHLYGDNLFSNISLIYSKYDYNLGVPGSNADQFDWNSTIRDLNIKEDFTYFLNAKNKINFGLNFFYHHFEPGRINVDENSYFTDLVLTNYNALEGAVYASNEQNIGRLLTVKYGLRLSVFQQVGKGKVREYLDPEHPDSDEVISEKEYDKWERIGDPFIYLEPRLSLKYTLDENSSFKASYNRMVQNLHLITNTNSPTPLDIWLPSNKYIKPLITDQVAVGYFRNFKNNVIETSLEGYYKNMQNVLDYKDGAELFLNEDLETELLRGSGYSYGLEAMIKKQEGKLNGWIGYTWSKTMRKVPGINNGDPYPSNYDRPHDVSVVMNYELSKRWNVSASWLYSTGTPVSYPALKYEVQGNQVYYYSSRNSNRIPDYHRMDLSFTYDFKKNDRKKFKQSINISLYNVYGRRNAYSVTFKQNEDNPNVSEATRLSIIGSMIPSVTYNFSF